MSNIQLDAMCRIGTSSKKGDYVFDRNIMVSSMSGYKCSVSCFRVWFGNNYTAHFTKTVDSSVKISDKYNDYIENEWENFDAEIYDIGFKGRWEYEG